MARLLGIDAGTTSVSAILYDSDNGKIISHGSRNHGAYIQGLPEGFREQDPKLILSAIERLLSSMSNGTALHADAVCITGQMHGFIMLDGKGRPIGNFITWEDRRAAAESPAGRTWLAEFRDVLADTTPAASGVIAAPGFAATNIYILEKTGKIPENATYASAIQDWLLFELSGNSLPAAVTDQTFAHSIGLYLPKERKWNEKLLERIGVDLGFLPEIRNCGTMAGQTRETRFPLAAGIPLFVGAGDNQASFLGSVSDYDGMLLLNIGTGSQVSILQNKFKLRAGLDIRPFLNDMYLVVGAPLCGGRALAALKDLIRNIGIDFFNRDIPVDRLYELMQQYSVIDTDMQCRVSFTGTRTNPDERGAFENVSLENFTIGNFSGSIMHGLARELKGLYVAMDAPRTAAAGSGNGIRKNYLLRSCLSEHFGMEVRIPEFTEEAAFGAALTAGVGKGVFRNYREAATHVRYQNA